MIDIYIIMVIYNTNIKDSITVKTIREANIPDCLNIEWIICDNSTQIINHDYSNIKKPINYISMGGNKGLSKAYNKAINTYLLNNKDCYIILFDDDTSVSKEYFIEMIKSINHYDIVGPKVFSNDLMISPARIDYDLHVHTSNINDINEKNITLINSGMMIKSSIFLSYRYNEEMFLDYIDHMFIRDMKEKKLKIGYSNAIIFQDFSIKEDSYEESLSRLNLLKKDLKIFCREKKLGNIYYFLKIFIRKLKIRFHSL